jgi:hypothetical protein
VYAASLLNPVQALGGTVADLKRHLRVAIVSPSDVSPERDAVIKVVGDLNRNLADELGYHLDCYRWETDVHPQFFASNAQETIDRSLRIHQCDIVVGIFWTRFGTPVLDAGSGTEHELRLAYEEWKRNGKRPVVMLYFKTDPFTPRTVDDAEQMKMVLTFKASFAQQAIYGDIQGGDAFQQQLQTNLSQVLREGLEPPESSRRVSQAARPVISRLETLRFDQVPLHTFSGLQRDVQETSVFQDFQIDPKRITNPNPVTHLWADVYRGCAITAAVEEADPPFLSVTFENKPSSWPCNLTIRPTRERAVAADGYAALAFEARVDAAAVTAGSLQEVAIAIRVVNGWYQHWSYGPSGRYLLLTATESWQTFAVPLDPDEWWLFPSDGNHYYGPPTAEFTVIAGVVLEFGSHDIHRAGPGRATIQIRNVHLT